MKKILHLTNKNRLLWKGKELLKINSMIAGKKEELENEVKEISQKVEQKVKEMQN